jgi:hypothetical protein
VDHGSVTPYTVYEYADENGHSDVQEWRRTLRDSNPRAAAKVDLLIRLLEQNGTGLRFPVVSNVRGPIYELRGKARSDTIRLYYWQEDRTTFVIAAGELKQKRRADQKLVAKALAAYHEYRRE